MELIIIKAILIIILIGILYHLLCHLLIIFYPYARDMAIKTILENPYKHVVDEHMCYVIRNMVYLFFVIVLLIAACNGNMRFEKNTKQIEISNVKSK